MQLFGSIEFLQVSKKTREDFRSFFVDSKPLAFALFSWFLALPSMEILQGIRSATLSLKGAQSLRWGTVGPTVDRYELQRLLKQKFRDGSKFFEKTEEQWKTKHKHNTPPTTTILPPLMLSKILVLLLYYSIQFVVDGIFSSSKPGIFGFSSQNPVKRWSFSPSVSSTRGKIIPRFTEEPFKFDKQNITFWWLMVKLVCSPRQVLRFFWEDLRTFGCLG